MTREEWKKDIVKYSSPSYYVSLLHLETLLIINKTLRSHSYLLNRHHDLLLPNSHHTSGNIIIQNMTA